MQATGQYHGVQDVPQFVGTTARVPPPHGHIFNISHESMPPPAAVPSAIEANNHGPGAAHGLSLSHSSSHQHQQHHPQQQFTQLLSQQQQQQFHIQLTNPQQSGQSVQAHPGYGGGIGSNTAATSAIPMTAPINSMPTNNTIPSDTHHHQQHNYHHQQQQFSVAPNQLNSVGIGGGNDGNTGITGNTDNDSSVQHLMSNNINDNNNNNVNDISKMQSTAMGREGSEDGDDLQDEELGDRGGAGNRWPRQEAMALLKIRADMDAAFKDSSLKTPLWEEISRKMAELGYQRSAKKCKEKFENVHKYYKRTKDGKAGRQDGKNYRFFSQLEALYGKSNDNNGNSNNNNNITNSNNGNNNSSQLPSSAASMHLPSSNIYNGAGHDNAAIGLMASTRAQPAQNYTLERPHSTTNTSAFNFSFDLTSEEDDDYGDEDEDDEYGEPGARAREDVLTGGTNSRKRKRAKSMKKYIHFFEKVMKKVLEKQEEMQQRFLEALERRDKERMEREKSWRMQEMARMSRENDIRAQERALSASRDASIIAFLQKTTGISISLPPQIANMQNPSLNYKPVPVPASGPGQVTIVPLSTTTPTHHHEELDANDRDMNDPNSKRWPKTEVLALIKLRTDLDKRFHEPGSKAVLWEDISSGMSALGYSRTAKRCKEKWENINKYFKKAKESNKKRPEDAKTCPYFHHLNALYQQGLLGGGGNKQQSAHLSRDKAATNPDGENSDHDVNAEQPETSNAGQEDSGHGQEDDSDGSEETNDPAPNPNQNEVPNHGGNDESTTGTGAAAMAISGPGPTPSNQGAVMHLFLSPDSRVNNNNMSINESAASTDANGANKQTTPASSNQIPLVMGNMEQ